MEIQQIKKIFIQKIYSELCFSKNCGIWAKAIPFPPIPNQFHVMRVLSQMCTAKMGMGWGLLLPPAHSSLWLCFYPGRNSHLVFVFTPNPLMQKLYSRPRKWGVSSPIQPHLWGRYHTPGTTETECCILIITPHFSLFVRGFMGVCWDEKDPQTLY